MELESPTESVCPLCFPFEVHEVEVNENSAGRPYFQCTEQKTTVNLFGDESEDLVRDYVHLNEHADRDELESMVLSSPSDDSREGDDDESPSDEDSMSVQDLFGFEGN